MYVYRLTDQKDNRVKYIWITENLETGLWRKARNTAWMLATEWVVDYLTVADRPSANRILSDLLIYYTPEHNDTSAKEVPEGEKEEIAEWVKGLKWSRYGEMDFTYNPPGEKEVLRRIGNAETNILLLAAMSSGMVSREAAFSICGSQKSFSKVMPELKKEKTAEIVYGESPRMLHILSKGCEKIEILAPGTVEAQKANRMSKSTAQRKYDVSMTLYLLQIAGGQIIPVRKAPLVSEERILEPAVRDGELLVYGPLEFKKLHPGEMQGSRMSALAMSQSRIFIFYYMGDRNIRYQEAVERRVCTLLRNTYREREIMPVVIGKPEMLDEILNNQSRKEKAIGAQSISAITPDMNMWFIPENGFVDTAVGIRLLTFGDREKIKRLVEHVKEKSGLPVINMLQIHLSSVLRLSMESKAVAVLCRQQMEEYIKKLCPAAVVFPVKEEKLPSLLLPCR